jgi:hypothetical protein
MAGPLSRPFFFSFCNVQSKSRDWFEEDESFQARVEACEATWLARSKQKKKAAKKTGPATGTTSAWSTTAASRPAGGGWGKPAAAKNKPTGKAGTGGVFGAMMLDSDSD